MALSPSKLKNIDPRIKLTVYGYIRNMEKQFFGDKESVYYHIPPLIIHACIAYYFYTVRFDVMPDVYKTDENCKDLIKNNGSIIKRFNVTGSKCPVFSIGCSKGWDHGKHRFHLKMVNRQDDLCGITSDINQCKRSDLHINSSSGDAYYFWFGGIVLTNDKCQNCPSRQNHLTALKNGDIFTVDLDLEEYKVWFSINGKMIGNPYSVAKGNTYYPFLCTQMLSSEYHVADQDLI